MVVPSGFAWGEDRVAGAGALRPAFCRIWTSWRRRLLTLRRASTRSCSCGEILFTWADGTWACKGDSGGVVSWPVEAAGTAGAVIEEAGSSKELAGDRVASPGAVMVT